MDQFDPMPTAAFVGEVGVAREDITPPAGIYARSWGLAAHDVAEGVHRPLTLTALALASEDNALLLLIAVDLGRWRSREDEWLVRGAVLDALKLEAARVLICLSHTHAGPSIYRNDADKPGGHLIAPYLEMIRDRAVQAALSAMQSRRPARLSWRYGKCDLACNRDLPEKTTGRYIVGCNPAAAADDTLLVGRVEDEVSGRLLAVVVSYACHPTTLAWQNRLISPDYVGALREVVEAETHSHCIFLQGASGDLAPAHQYVGDVAVADRHGRRVGRAVMGVLESWPERQLAFDHTVESGAPLALFRVSSVQTTRELRAISRSAVLDLKPLPTVAEIEEQLHTCSDRALRERLWRQRANRLIVGDGATSPAFVWTWRVGEALFIAQSNEAYSALQLECHHIFGRRPVVVLNLVNGGSAGYLPPREHYSRDQYSVWQTPFAAGALESVIATAIAAAHEIIAD